MLRARRDEPAFSPFAEQEVLDLDDRVLALRRAGSTAQEVISLTNVSSETVQLQGLGGVDALTGTVHGGSITLRPHGIAWLK